MNLGKARRKGQVEFIVVAALIIIAITAVILASRQAVIPPAFTPGLPEEAKTIKDSVVNLIRAGAKDKLLLIYNQGGTQKPSLSVEFGAFDTAVWSACGETNIPDVAKEIGVGLWAYLRENLKDEMEFYGKKVKFDFSRPKYEVDIIKDRVNVRLYLPTKVEDYDIQQPYEITVPTKLYDVLDFSKNFVNDAGSTRFFEMVTLTSMMHSNPESDAWVPVAGAQVGCGNVLFKTRNQLLPGIKGIIKYTVSHVVWNTRPLKLAENPFYPISSVGGKFYPDMQVAFAYPPSWDAQIDRYFMFTPEPLRVIPKPIMPIIAFCMAPYSVGYTFRYPVVVMVEDSLLNQWFKFAIMVDIQNTQPGNCSAQFSNVSEYSQICVSDAKCNAKVTVTNSTGSPIEGADVSFYICDIGTTNSNGVAQGKIPCMVSELHAYKEGYRSFGDLFRSDQLQDKDVTLQNTADTFTIYFKGLEVEATGDNLDGTTGDGKFGSYQVKSSSKDITPKANFGDKDLIVITAFSPVNPNYFTGEDTALLLSNYDENGNLVSKIVTSGIQPIAYNFTLTVADNETGMPLGYLNSSIQVNEGDKEIYVYMPVVLKADGNDVSDPGIDPDEANQLTDAIRSSCGDPVRTTQASC